MWYGVKFAGVVAALTLCFSGTKAANYEFTAGDVGGVLYTTAAGLSQIVQAAHPDVVLKTVPGGGVTNPAKLQAGTSQFGLVQSIFATAAVKRSEEHTSELQSLMRISYAVFCLKKKKEQQQKTKTREQDRNKQA